MQLIWNLTYISGTWNPIYDLPNRSIKKHLNWDKKCSHALKFEGWNSFSPFSSINLHNLINYFDTDSILFISIVMFGLALLLRLGPRVLKLYCWSPHICIYLRFAVIFDLRSFYFEARGCLRMFEKLWFTNQIQAIGSARQCRLYMLLFCYSLYGLCL